MSRIDGHPREPGADQVGHGEYSPIFYGTGSIDGIQLPSSDVRFTHSDLCVNSGSSKGSRSGEDGGKDHARAGGQGDLRHALNLIPKDGAFRQGGAEDGREEARERNGGHARQPEQRGGTAPAHEIGLAAGDLKRPNIGAVNFDEKTPYGPMSDIVSDAVGGSSVDMFIMDDRGNQPGQPPQRNEARMVAEELVPNTTVHLKGRNRPMNSGGEDGKRVDGLSNASRKCNRLHEHGAKLEDPSQEQADGLSRARGHSRRRGAGEGALACDSRAVLARRAGQHAARGLGVGGVRGGAQLGCGVEGNSAAQ